MRTQYDQYHDLRDGKEKTFIHLREKFTVNITNGIWTIKDSFGNVARISWVGYMTDLFCLASCLQEHRKDLVFDKHGNIIPLRSHVIDRLDAAGCSYKDSNYGIVVDRSIYSYDLFKDWTYQELDTILIINVR